MPLLMYLKSYSEFMLDLPHRFKAIVSRRINRRSKFSQSNDQSDSEITRYSRTIWKFIENEKTFNKFRRNFYYRQILEHVDFKLGKDYLSKIQSIEPSFLPNNYDSIKNDKIGKPRRYQFSGCGSISPTTLRYISVMLELKKLFDLKGRIKVAEIGIGYGGQFVLINEFMNVESYSAFDLPQVLELSEKFISSVSKTDKFVKKDIYNVQSEQFDLLISNYAFSELPIHIQREYVEKIISRAKMGYMIMNSGKTDLTGRSAGKISLSELQNSITGLEVLQEIPLTGADNYLLVWGRS